MKLEQYKHEIEKVESEIRDILLSLKLKISFNRFISFSSLFPYLKEAPFKLIASETYVNLDDGKRKTIKVQIIHLGSNKLSKMKPEEIRDRLAVIIRLELLHKCFRSLSEAYEARVFARYAENTATDILKTFSGDKFDSLIELDNTEMYTHTSNATEYSLLRDNFDAYKNEFYTESGNYLKS